MTATLPPWTQRRGLRRTAGALLVTAGLVGIVAGLVVAVAGWRLVGALDASVGQSLTLTAEALEALDGSLTLSAETVAVLDQGLGDVQRATGDAAAALTDGERLVGDSARLTGTRLADAVAAVDASLPAVERVAAVIDDTLVAVDALPVGPDYDPEQPFDASIRDLAGALRGVPQELPAGGCCGAGQCGGRRRRCSKSRRTSSRGRSPRTPAQPASSSRVARSRSRAAGSAPASVSRPPAEPWRARTSARKRRMVAAGEARTQAG